MRSDLTATAIGANQRSVGALLQMIRDLIKFKHLLTALWTHNETPGTQFSVVHDTLCKLELLSAAFACHNAFGAHFRVVTLAEFSSE